MKKLFLTLLFIAAPTSASVVRVNQTSPGQWQLLVDSAPYIIRGVGYTDDIVGVTPSVCVSTLIAGTTYYDGWQDYTIRTSSGPVNPTVPSSTGTVWGLDLSYNDQARNNQEQSYEPMIGDMKFMQDMHVNTVRFYNHPSTDTAVAQCYAWQGPVNACGGILLQNHPPNHKLLQNMFNGYGIRFAIGDPIGAYAGSSCLVYPGPTDYTSSIQISSMVASVKAMARDYKDEPGLLMYILGNENEYDFTLTNASANPQAYYTFVDSCAQILHNLDPNHPVALAAGEDTFRTYVASYAPHVDIYGVNSYRDPGSLNGFGDLFLAISTTTNKPMMLTEFGFYFPHIINPGGIVANNSFLDENFDAAVRHNYWCDIQNNTYGNGIGNSIGGFNYSWLDSWWQGCSPSGICLTQSGTVNQATQGIAGQGAGTNSPFARQFRASFYMFQRLWDPDATCECGTGP